jgi:hypothetical protein
LYARLYPRRAHRVSYGILFLAILKSQIPKILDRLADSFAAVRCGRGICYLFMARRSTINTILDTGILCGDCFSPESLGCPKGLGYAFQRSTICSGIGVVSCTETIHGSKDSITASAKAATLGNPSLPIDCTAFSVYGESVPTPRCALPKTYSNLRGTFWRRIRPLLGGPEHEEELSYERADCVHVATGDSKDTDVEACRKMGFLEQTFFRWKVGCAQSPVRS